MTAGAMETQPAPPLTRAGRALGPAWPPRARRWRWRSGSSPRAAACPSTSTATRCRPARARWPSPRCSRAPSSPSAAASGVWIARRAAGLDAIERDRAPAGAAVPGGVRAAAASLAALDRPARDDVRRAGVGVRAVAAGADARRAGGPAPAARAPARARRRRPRRRRRRARARALAAGGGGRDRRAPPRDLLLEHHDPEPLQMQTAGYDLGIENNLVWNAAHWNGPLFKTSVQMGGPRRDAHRSSRDVHLVSDRHPLPAGAAARDAAGAAVAADRRRRACRCSRTRAATWARGRPASSPLLFLFNAPMHGSNLYDFHYLPFAPLFLWTTLALLAARRDRWAAVAIVLTLANREDMSALLIVVGLYLLLTGERPRAGLIVAAIGAVYFVVVKFIVDAALPRRRDRLRPPVQGPGPAGRARASAASSRPCSATPATRPPRCSRRTRSSTSCRSWRRSRSFPGGGRSACCARCPASSSRCSRRSTRG